jgi:energy-coupling factor transporter ATP-binding protein EcfA2
MSYVFHEPEDDIVQGPEKLQIQPLDWDDFLEWFESAWKPGQHVAVVGPTGTGKSTLMVGILPLRKYVIALDPKGGDDTLSALERKGFNHSSWPPNRDIRKHIEKGQPARLIVGSGLGDLENLPALRGQISRALDDAYNEKGWTVYLDEAQIVGDRRLMNLGAKIERNNIAARSRAVSMVASFQRPANVPRTTHEMSTWFFVYYTRDREVVGRIAEMAGRERQHVTGMVKGLPEYYVLLFSRNPRDPVRITVAPPVD